MAPEGEEPGLTVALGPETRGVVLGLGVPQLTRLKHIPIYIEYAILLAYIILLIECMMTFSPSVCEPMITT